MAKRRNTAMQEAAAAAAAAAVAASTGDEFIGLDDPDAEEIAEDVLDGLRRLDQGGNKVTWYVYSETPGRSGESEGYIEKLRSEQLDESRFKAVYGPGEYRLVGRTRDGGYVRGSHKVIKISDIGAARPRGAEQDAVSLLREMRAADEQRAAKRAEDFKTYASILGPTLATLGAAIISRRPSIDIAALVTALRPQQSSLVEMTTALTNLKQLEGGNKDASSIETVLKVLERVNDLPTGGGDTGWIGFLREVVRETAPHAREIIGQLTHRTPAGQLPPGAAAGPAFGPGVTPKLPQPGQPTNNGAAPPTTAPVAAPQAPTQPTVEVSDMWRVAEPWLRRKAEELLDAAATNMPIELEAEHLLTAAEKKFGAFVTHEDLRAMLERPEWWQYVVAFHPPLQPYQAWLDDLRREMLLMLAEDGQDDKSAPQEPQEKRE